VFRIGNGYDVHRLVEGRKLILGGVEIPYSKGLEGHSDADALLHALCDALLGACGLGDLGHHFPDTDPEWKDISSLTLLEKVKAAVADKGYRVMNADATIVAQKPKLASYIPKMRKNIAHTLGWFAGHPEQAKNLAVCSTSRPPPRKSWASPGAARGWRRTPWCSCRTCSLPSPDTLNSTKFNFLCPFWNIPLCGYPAPGRAHPGC